MFFETIKKSFLKSVQEAGSAAPNNKQQPQVRRRSHRRLTNFYDSICNIKNAFAAYRTIKASYDPYQMKQYADESGFDPYYDETPNSDMEIEEKLDVYHDARDNFFDECLPAAKRIRTMAASAFDSAAHSLAWGAMAAAHYVYTSVPTTAPSLNTTASVSPAVSNNVSANNTTSFDFTSNINMNIPNNSNSKKKTVSMRGFGVDFSAIVERSPEMKRNMENVERHIRVLCLEANEATQQEADRKRIVSCGGDQRTSLKRTIDDTWGFVEKDYSINFKSTIPPSKPPRRVYVQPTQLRREVM